MAKLFTSKIETVIVGTVVVLGGGEGPIVNPDNSQRSRVAGTKSMESNTTPPPQTFFNVHVILLIRMLMSFNAFSASALIVIKYDFFRAEAQEERGLGAQLADGKNIKRLFH